MQIRIAAVLAVVFVSGCRLVEPAPPPGAPSIGSFTASKTRTAPGEEVTLSFSTTGATKVELSDDSGHLIQLEGAVDSGTAVVAPTRSAFYVLRATGAGGRDSAFVQIAVNEPLKELFLIAVPASLDSGEQGQLLWGAPGASSVTLQTGAGAPQALTGSTGSVTVTPAQTENYTLTAQGAPGTPPLTALAEIQVRPVLRDAAMTAAMGVQPGQTLNFTWTTAGAARVTVSEQTFGQLTAVTDPASVATGSFDYVLPANLPNGIAIADGLPLRFLVEATAGDVTVSRTFSTVVGDVPVISQLTAPEFTSVGGTTTIGWKTLNATQVTLTAEGLPIFRTLPGAQARVDQGTFTLPAPLAMTHYELIASNDRGATARKGFNVSPVPLPVIATYTLTPTINAFGDPVTVRWTTTNAVRVQVRLENGPTLAVVTTPAQVTSGSVVLTPATSARIAVEAYNAAGDLVREVKAFTFRSGAVTVTPSPMLRGAQGTLTWTLAPTVLETVGLPTPPPAPVTASALFIDLATLATAQELTIADPASGAEQLTLPPGFQFPLLGTVRPALFVAVDGFIAFAPPPVLVSNSDFTATGNSAPSMLAPFWDDLTMTATSKVLSALQTTSNGERYLVVQWDHFQKAGDGNSELTFQVHLYETGQVAFLYKTLTGALDSATIGVKDTVYPVVQQYAFNSATTTAAPAMELNYFSGGPADGNLTFTATRAFRIEFFGRTATGLVPVSAEVRAFGPGDVSVTEVMPLPEATVTSTGQWIELRNNADASVDFEGLQLTSLASSPDGGYFIGPGAVVAPGGYFVVGQSTNPTDTGGAPVSEVATDVMPLAVPDSVKVSIQGTTLGSLGWDAGVAGRSVQVMTGALVAAGQSPVCTGTLSRTFGTAGALGTPGAANEPCAPYVVTSIPGAWVPAPAGSTILASLFSDDDYDNEVLPQAFTYFGTPVTDFSLSTNGFITLGFTLTGSSSGNDTVPSTSSPNGVIAPFWDDLVRDTGKNAMWRATDRTIIAWEGFRLYSGTATTSKINVQVHLLDTGVIEFHYGDLSTTSTTQALIDRTLGKEATVWIEKPDGTLAVPWAINQLNGVAPNSGLRFTPVP